MALALGTEHKWGGAPRWPPGGEKAGCSSGCVSETRLLFREKPFILYYKSPVPCGAAGAGQARARQNLRSGRTVHRAVL